MAKRKLTDWDSIEPLYRAGSLSIHKITDQYLVDHANSGRWKKTVTHTAINKKAKEKGWTRNLAGQVKDRIKEKLVSKIVSNGNQTDQDMIEKAADVGSEVVIRHRKEILALLKREDTLLKELDTDTEPNLKDKTIILKNIAGVRAQRIAMEREAYSLNDQPKTGGTFEDFLKGLK